MMSPLEASQLLRISQGIQLASLRLTECLKAFEAVALSGDEKATPVEREKVHAQMDHLLDLFEQGQHLKKKLLNL